MKHIGIFLFIAFSMINLNANDSVESELSHFIGGAVMAGGITAIIDGKYPEYKEDREKIGFWTSSIAVVIEQAIEYKLHGGAKGQAMDAISHIAGSAIGAYTTNKYLLLPIVKKSADNTNIIGLNIKYRF